MNRESLLLKTGGQFLVQPIGSQKFFSREQFSDEHREIDQMVREFAQEHIYPNVHKVDKHNKEVMLELMKEMADLGLFGVDVPEKYGGMDLDKITHFL